MKVKVEKINWVVMILVIMKVKLKIIKNNKKSENKKCSPLTQLMMLPPKLSCDDLSDNEKESETNLDKKSERKNQKTKK